MKDLLVSTDDSEIPFCQDNSLPAKTAANIQHGTELLKILQQELFAP
jgi:hypothetical protein